MDKPVGGDTDDSFVATGATLGSLDVITGGAGTDTLTIKDTTKASSAGMPATLSGIENIELTSDGGMGVQPVTASGATTATAGIKEVQKITISSGTVGGGTVAVTDYNININGVDYSPSAYTAENTPTTLNTLDAALVAILGDSVTVAHTDLVATVGSEADGFLTITAKEEGVDIPTITITLTDANTTTATTANTAEPTLEISSAGNRSQIQTIAITSSSTTASADAYTVHFDGAKSVVYTGATATSAATAVAATVNALNGSDIATAVGNVVTLKSAAGVALPNIAVSATGTTDAPSISNSYVAGAAVATTAASGGVTEVVYDASKATEKVTAVVSADINTKLAATAVASLTTTAGSVEVDGGADVTTVGTGATTIYGSKLATVNVTTGAAAVAIGATSGTTGTTPALTSATVTGGSTVLVTDEYSGVSSGTLTTVTLSKIGGAATLEGKSLTNLVLGTQTTAQTVTITNAATEAHTLSLTVGKTGSSSAAVTVADATASAINVEFTAAGANIALDGDSTLLSVVASGAGGGKLNLNGGSSGNGIVSFDASGNSGGLDISNIPAGVKTFSTGSGGDTFTQLQTAIANINAGDGADTVTIGAALAAGSTLDLGAGDDILLKAGSGSPSVATDSTTVITTVDGGEGTDTLSANLVTAGNGDQFKNFEVLGLTASTTLDASLLTGSAISALALISGGGTFTGVNPSQTLTITNIGSNSATTTLSYGTSALGASDNFTVNFADPNADKTTATAWASVTSANVEGGTITAAGVENYSLISGGTLAWNSITLGANNDAETVTITGASNLDVAFASGFGSTTAPATGVSLIDGSAASGKLAINAANVVDALTGFAIKGGSGDDTITTGDGQVVTVTLGAGSDTLNLANSTPTLTATATAAEVVSELVTITDFTYGEKIDFQAGTKTVATTAIAEIDVTAATSLFEAVNLAAAGGTNNTGDTEVNWFVYGGNTYLLYDEDAASSTDMDAGDVLVKVIGIHDFDNSTLSTGAVFEYVQ